MRIFQLLAILIIGFLFLSAATGCQSLRQGNAFFPASTYHNGGCSGNGGLFGGPT